MICTLNIPSHYDPDYSEVPGNFIHKSMIIKLGENSDVDLISVFK